MCTRECRPRRRGGEGGDGARKGQREEAAEAGPRRWGPANRPPPPPKRSRSHYEHIGKPLAEALRTVFRSIYAYHEQRQRIAVVSLSPVLTLAPFRRRYETTPRPAFFWLTSAFPVRVFLAALVRATPPRSRSALLGPDQSMQDFCVDRLD